MYHRSPVAIATIHAVVRVVVVIELRAGELGASDRSIFGFIRETSRQIPEITRRLKAGTFQVAPVYGHYFELRGCDLVLVVVAEDVFLLLLAHNVHHEEEHGDQ